MSYWECSLGYLAEYELEIRVDDSGKEQIVFVSMGHGVHQ